MMPEVPNEMSRSARAMAVVDGGVLPSTVAPSAGVPVRSYVHAGQAGVEPDAVPQSIEDGQMQIGDR